MVNDNQIPLTRPLSRRSALGMLGAASVALGGPLAHRADAATGGQDVHGWCEPSPGAPPPGLRPGGAYDQYLRQLADRDQFSGTVLVAWRGTPVLSRSYQMANKQLGIPNQEDTIFPLASLTKWFTGAAVTQLAAQGKIGFYASLGSYLTGFPSGIADTVTIHQLLTHTSGMADFSRSAAWRQESMTWTTPTAAFNGTLQFVQQMPLASTPGTQYSYSNTNYFLLGAVVAAVSGQPYWDYVPQHVFAPAGMDSTGFFSGHQQLTDPRFAHNYSGRDANGQRQDITDLASAGPNGYDGAGGAYSNAPDLLRFASALSRGTLLRPAWVQVLTTGKHPISPAERNPDQAPSESTLIGYGTEERIVHDQRAFGHTGGFMIMTRRSTEPGGGSTSLSVYPGLDVVAVILSNYFLYPGIGTILEQQDRIITGG